VIDENTAELSGNEALNPPLAAEKAGPAGGADHIGWRDQPRSRRCEETGQAMGLPLNELREHRQATSGPNDRHSEKTMLAPRVAKASRWASNKKRLKQQPRARRDRAR